MHIFSFGSQLLSLIFNEAGRKLMYIDLRMTEEAVNCWITRHSVLGFRLPCDGTTQYDCSLRFYTLCVGQKDK